MKSVQMRSFFWSVFSRIRSEYGMMRARGSPVFGDFSRGGYVLLIGAVLWMRVIGVFTYVPAGWLFYQFWRGFWLPGVGGLRPLAG